jgi:hypothetical protein
MRIPVLDMNTICVPSGTSIALSIVGTLTLDGACRATPRQCSGVTSSSSRTSMPFDISMRRGAVVVGGLVVIRFRSRIAVPVSSSTSTCCGWLHAMPSCVERPRRRRSPAIVSITTNSSVPPGDSAGAS